MLIDGVDVRARRSARCVARWGSSSRRRSCSTTRSPPTSPSPSLARRSRRSSGRPAWPAPMSSCWAPRGYGTEIGERGTRSPGASAAHRHRQAILADPRVLILDDATSAVDPTKEHEIRDALTEVMRNRTTIVIAHRRPRSRWPTGGSGRRRPGGRDRHPQRAAGHERPLPRGAGGRGATGGRAAGRGRRRPVGGRLMFSMASVAEEDQLDRDARPQGAPPGVGHARPLPPPAPAGRRDDHPLHADDPRRAVPREGRDRPRHQAGRRDAPSTFAVAAYVVIAFLGFLLNRFQVVMVGRVGEGSCATSASGCSTTSRSCRCRTTTARRPA